MVPCLVTVPVREVLPGRTMLRSATVAACSRCRWAVISAASRARVTHGSAAGSTRDSSSDCQADGCPPPGVAVGQTGINNLNGAVFTESGGTFTEASEVLPPANTTNAAFAAGSNIGMSADGSVIAFGAPTASAGAALESGEVFVATETDAGTWALTGTGNEPNPVSDDDLGGGDQSVAVAGNGSAIMAGARAANGQTGQAFVFPVS
jgi:hypothetical protein